MEKIQKMLSKHVSSVDETQSKRGAIRHACHAMEMDDPSDVVMMASMLVLFPLVPPALSTAMLTYFVVPIFPILGHAR
jgi:hypothetical protein